MQTRLPMKFHYWNTCGTPGRVLRSYQYWRFVEHIPGAGFLSLMPHMGSGFRLLKHNYGYGLMSGGHSDIKWVRQTPRWWTTNKSTPFTWYRSNSNLEIGQPDLSEIQIWSSTDWDTWILSQDDLLVLKQHWLVPRKMAVQVMRLSFTAHPQTETFGPIWIYGLVVTLTA